MKLDETSGALLPGSLLLQGAAPPQGKQSQCTPKNIIVGTSAAARLTFRLPMDCTGIRAKTPDDTQQDFGDSMWARALCHRRALGYAGKFSRRRPRRQEGTTR